MGRVLLALLVVALAACDEGADRLREIEMIETTGKTDEAMKQYQLLAKQFPDKGSGKTARRRVSELGVKLGNEQLARGDVDRAVALWDAAIGATDEGDPRRAELKKAKDEAFEKRSTSKFRTQIIANSGVDDAEYSPGGNRVVLWYKNIKPDPKETLYDAFVELVGIRNPAKGLFDRYPEMQEIELRVFNPDPLGTGRLVRMVITLSRGVAATLQYDRHRYLVKESNYRKTMDPVVSQMTADEFVWRAKAATTVRYP